MQADAPIRRASEDRLGADARAVAIAAVLDPTADGQPGADSKAGLGSAGPTKPTRGSKKTGDQSRGNAGSLVLAINGPWGSGKSSLAQLVANVLEERRNSPNGPDLLDFNPWLYAKRGSLVVDFFANLRTWAGSGDQGGGDIWSDIWRYGVAFWTRSGILPRRSLHEARRIRVAKDHLCQELINRPRRIVVFMDDIDRLTVEEIGRLFWLVKMVADLPNVIYVLVYDRDVVVRALDSLFDGHGLAYLERIVQATVDLPLPGPLAVKRELDLYVQQMPEGVSRADVAAAIDGLWTGCLEVLVPTLRHAKLLVNAIEVGHALHPAIPAGILVALESLRTLASGVFDQVRTDPSTYLRGSYTAPVVPPGARASYASAVSHLLSTALPTAGSLSCVWSYFYAG